MEKSYNLVLTSKKVPFVGGIGGDGKPIVWSGSRYSGFIGEVFSFYEDHTPETLAARLDGLATEHGITVAEIIAKVR